MTLSSRRWLIGAAVMGLAACETQPPRLPPSSALPPPRPGPTEPAPTPTSGSMADERTRRLQESPYGPAAMPGFAGQPEVGTDMQLAPMPANSFR